MKNNNSIEDILGGLRAQTPHVDDEEMFIDEIMLRVEEAEEVEMPSAVEGVEASSVPTFIIMLRTVSSIAAAILIGLFIYVNVDSHSDTDSASVTSYDMSNIGNPYSEIRTDCSQGEIIRQYADMRNKKNRKNQLISMLNEN